MSRTIWTILGIAPTDDTAEIRRAYVAALKQIDMDREPRRYIELRDARDMATKMARRVVMDEPAEAHVPAVVPALPDEPIAAQADQPAADTDDAADACNAIARLLAGGEGAELEPALQEQLVGHFDALLADPRMELVGFRVAVEQRLAALIADHLPRADPLVPPAVAFFAWEANRDHYKQSPAVLRILARAADLRFAVNTRAPTEALYATWKDVAAPINVRVDTPDRPAPNPVPEPGEDHLAKIAELLLPHGGRDETRLGSSEQQIARYHLNQLFADPRMEMVGFRLDVERRLSALIAHAIPRSDPLIEPATSFFEWDLTKTQVHQSQEVAYILHRAGALRFIENFRKPGHAYHAAWTELTTPVTIPGRDAVRVTPTAIHKLLLAIRNERPELERELEPDRVAMWEARLGAIRPGSAPPERQKTTSNHRLTMYLVGGAIVVVMLLMVLGSLTNVPQQPSIDRGAGDLTVTNADVDPVLRRIGGDTLTMARLDDENPRLFQLLRDRWEAANQQGQSLSNFQDQTHDFVVRRIGDAMRSDAGYDNVVAYQKARLAEAKAIRDDAPGACDVFFRDGTAPPTAVALEERRQAAVQPILLLTAPPDLEPQPWQVGAMPDALALRAAKRAHMSLGTFDAAVDGGGSGGQLCTARIALLETALESRAGERVLRNLR